MALSNGGPGNKGTKHQLCACNLNTKDGTIEDIINSVPLPYRPLHLSIDRQKKHALVAYNDPCFISVHQLETNGAISSRIKQDINLFDCDYRISFNNMFILCDWLLNFFS